MSTASMKCELCNVELEDAEDFILHCTKDEQHKELQTKFTDETYDFLFIKQEDPTTN